MNIKLLTLGTRGDVQPFVALGLGLQKAGHEVTICTAANYEAFVMSHGLSFFPIRADFMEFTQSEEGKKMLSGNVFHIIKNMKRLIFPMMEKMLEDLWAGASDADAIIYHPKAFGGYDIAEKLNVPVFIAHPVPAFIPTGEFPNPIVPVSTSLGAWGNKQTYAVNQWQTAPYLNLINKWREHVLHLPKRSVRTNILHIHHKPIPVLIGCSPSVVRSPADWVHPHHMSGFWFLDEQPDWNPPSELDLFLKSGKPPVCIGFSSMPLNEPERVKGMMVEALRRTGERGIMIAGWGNMKVESATEDLYFIDSVPHSWLFPRTSAVLHHGGAGTTAAALKAGKPMVVCPFTGDQPYWARTMHRIGVAPAPLPGKKMTAASVAEAIQMAVNTPFFREKAEKIGQAIERENGVQQTVSYIENYLT